MRKLLIALAVLIVLFVAADRISVAVAENQVSSRIAAAYQLPSKPAVGIAGFPFLTQVVAGDYQEIDISASQFQTNGVTLHNLSAHFMGVHASLSQLLGQGPSSVTADRATGSFTIDFTEINQEISKRLPAGIRLRPSGSELRVSGALDIQGFRRSCRATLALGVSGAGLVGTLVHPACRGVRLPAGALAAFLPTASFNIPLPPLPLHLHLAAVHVTPAGLEIGVSARNVQFAQV